MSTEEYLLKLRQKRYRRPQRFVKSLICLQASLPRQELQRKDGEVQRLTRQLEITDKELQDTKQQKIEMTKGLPKDLPTKVRQLHKLQLELKEKRQTQITLQCELRDCNNRERLLQRRLQDQKERERQQLQDSKKRERVLYRQYDNTEQDLHKQLHELTTTLQQTRQANATLQKQVQQLQKQSHWIVRREEIEMTDEVLGKGSWGEVKVAKFRGLRVAAKSLHEIILSPYNISVFIREMEIAALVRHPNLLQFIGATQVGTPIILSELMPTSLRKEIEKSPLTRSQIIRIAQDISAALNYLHLWQPHPILHRDVSSPNVLLEPSGSGLWKAKLSDLGSANLVQSISANSVAPGNPFYSAPEAPFPDQHSPAMDVFSFGVLLTEMILHQPPASKTADKMTQSETIQWPAMKRLVQRCSSRESQGRPSIAQVLTDLEHM